MGCLFALLAGGAPRLAFLIYWMARPLMVNAAFSGWFWPLLGFILLPFTTLMYVLLYTPGVGLRGWDWVWLGIAVLLDITSTSNTVYTNKQYVPGLNTNPT